MRLQIASDLHLDRLRRQHLDERLVRHAASSDLLILAGDIANGVEVTTLFADWPVPVLAIAGNHEFYEQYWPNVKAGMRPFRENGAHVRMLDDDVAVVGNTRFIGTTLWTDFELDAPRISAVAAQAIAEASMADYRFIRSVTSRLRAAETLQWHRASRAWLAARLDEPFDGRTVVISHHAPHRSSIQPRYATHPTNPAYASDLSLLMDKVDLWIHGHTHASSDYRIGRCRVIANPAGYALNDSDSGPPRLENEAFDSRRVVDLDA